MGGRLSEGFRFEEEQWAAVAATAAATSGVYMWPRKHSLEYFRSVRRGAETAAPGEIDF